MVTSPGKNSDIQIARFSLLQDLDFANMVGIPIEFGGRGGVVQIWGIHHSVGRGHSVGSADIFWGSALSSNPDHEGELVAGDLDEFMGSAAIYGNYIMAERRNLTTTGGFTALYGTAVIPLYGIIRPRKQIWVIYIIGFVGSYRFNIEVYYSEIDATLKQEAQVNYKYGKYRRGR